MLMLYKILLAGSNPIRWQSRWPGQEARQCSLLHDQIILQLGYWADWALQYFHLKYRNSQRSNQRYLLLLLRLTSHLTPPCPLLWPLRGWRSTSCFLIKAKWSLCWDEAQWVVIIDQSSGFIIQLNWLEIFHLERFMMCYPILYGQLIKNFAEQTIQKNWLKYKIWTNKTCWRCTALYCLLPGWILISRWNIEINDITDRQGQARPGLINKQSV